MRHPRAAKSSHSLDRPSLIKQQRVLIQPSFSPIAPPVEAVSKKRNVPWKVRDLWLDILYSLRRITWTISHVFREGNCVANCLASISGDLNSDQVFFFASELPRPVRLALQLAPLGLPNLRFIHS